MSTFGIPDPGKASKAVEIVAQAADNSALQLFKFEHQPVRIVLIDGAPWFVLADLCRALGIVNHGNVAARLDADVKGIHLTDTPGGQQNVVIVNESGMYEVVIRSDKKEAARFRRWVTHKVLPEIRRTGSYNHLPAQPRQLPSKKELAQWVVEAEERAEIAEAKVAELEPPAAAWNELAEAAGDYSVADAAKVLSRDPAIRTGQNRLFKVMRQHGWVYREDNHWRAYQAQVDAGRLVEKLGRRYWHADREEWVVPAPTIRVTTKGLADLQRHLGGGQQQLALAVAE